jgi:hypothetical protein
MHFKRFAPLPCAAALLTTLAIEAPARADDWTPLYVGQGNHIRLGLGAGMNFGDGTTAFGLQPSLSGRFRLNNDFGVLLDLPLMYASLSGDGGDGATRFDIGNIGAAVEYTWDEMGTAFSRFRFGITAPTLSVASVNGLADLGDVVMQGVNIALASGAAGLMDIGRYLPETLGITAEFLAEGQYEDVYIDIGAGLAGLIPTSDAAEFELLLQLRARMGIGTQIIGFAGITMVMIPTEIGVGINPDGGDAFQLGLQLGGIFKVGGGRIDIFAQLNLDDPAGFSFSDQGIFGLHAAGTIPF